MMCALFGRALLAAVLAAGAAKGEVPSESPYASYEFLIGHWDIAREAGGPPVARALLRWGPRNSYIWYAGSLVIDGAERPHFEGLLVWNGVQRNLDLLLSLDLEGGRIQERGVVSIQPDGTVVREVTASYTEGTRPIGQPAAGPKGATARFRQTFKRDGADRILTSVMRESGNGWVATFPASDRLVMTWRGRDAGEPKPATGS